MGDVFNEQIVKRQPKAKDALLRVALIIGVLVLVIAAFVIAPAFAPVISLVIGFVAFYLNGFLKVEYEYAYTNGELDIDIIYNRSRRKRVFSGNVKQIEIMAHVDDMMHAGSFSGAQEVLDYSSGVPGADTYAFMIAVGGKQTKIIIEPNEKLQNTLRSSMSRTKLHLKKPEYGGL